MASAQQTVVLVTGCSKGGIGFYLCEEFARRDCIVYATARRLEALEGFSHPRIRKLSLDCTKDESVKRAIGEVMSAEGHIDILVNNAGVICISPIADISIEQAQKTFDTNVFGCLRTAQAVIPHMASRKKGLIVNVGSIVGDIPTPWNGMYCASKAALHSVTELLHMELKPLGLRAMLLTPGSVKSNLATNQAEVFRLPDNSLYKAYMKQIIGRMYASQEAGVSMPTETFAQLAVKKILATNPPLYVILGGNTLVFSLLRWMPRAFVLWLIWRRFSQ